MSIGSHTIPQFYLKQFGIPSERKTKPARIWVYQKGKQPDQRATTRQGYENGYFGYKLPDGRLDESLEARMAKLEADCDDILVSAKSEFADLTSLSTRIRLAFYIALLFQRSTSKRKFSSGNWLKLKDPYSKLALNQEYLNDVATYFTWKTGESVSPDQIKELITKQAARCADRDNINNSFVSEILESVEAIKRELVAKDWQVWRAPPGAEFVTSDNPLGTFLRLTPNLWHPGHGFRKPNVVAVFPLAPSACLMMGIHGRHFQEVTEEMVMRVNDIIIRVSDKFVYSRNVSSKITEMVNEFGGTSVPGKSAFIAPFPDEKRIEEGLRKIMGIERQALAAST
jgi:hypothetical protein